MHAMLPTGSHATTSRPNTDTSTGRPFRAIRPVALDPQLQQLIFSTVVMVVGVLLLIAVAMWTSRRQ